MSKEPYILEEDPNLGTYEDNWWLVATVAIVTVAIVVVILAVFG